MKTLTVKYVTYKQGQLNVTYKHGQLNKSHAHTDLTKLRFMYCEYI